MTYQKQGSWVVFPEFILYTVILLHLYIISILVYIKSQNLCLLFFSVRLLSVLRGHLFFSFLPQRPMTSEFEGFLSRSYPLHYFLILILEKEPVFPFSMLSAKQVNYWYHFYNVFGMMRSLTGDWTRDLPHSKPAL